MRISLWGGALALAVGVFSGIKPVEAALTPAAILEKAEAIRMPGGDSRVETHVVSTRPDGHRDEASYEVLLKGRDRTLIKTLSPAIDRGTSLLLLAHDLWVFLPNVSKPVRVSLQQRLIGEVANGDLARANFIGDYSPKLIENKRTFYCLLLTAKSENVTYGQVKLWIHKTSFRPMRAAFYAASGRILKVGSYEDYKSFQGIMRPSRLVFTDAVEKGKQSTILYSEIARESFPEKLFSKDYLKKLKY